MNTDKCPKCGESWIGESILETFLYEKHIGNPFWSKFSDDEIREKVKSDYGKEDATWGRQIGIELPYDNPKHYDGVSFWQCPDCNTRFDRFTGKEEEI